MQYVFSKGRLCSITSVQNHFLWSWSHWKTKKCAKVSNTFIHKTLIPTCDFCRIPCKYQSRKMTPGPRNIDTLHCDWQCSAVSSRGNIQLSLLCLPEFKAFNFLFPHNFLLTVFMLVWHSTMTFRAFVANKHRLIYTLLTSYSVTSSNIIPSTAEGGPISGVYFLT